MDRIDEEANEIVVEEIVIDSINEAIIEAVERDDEEASEVFETEKTSVELISEATGESKDPGSKLQ